MGIGCREQSAYSEVEVASGRAGRGAPSVISSLPGRADVAGKMEVGAEPRQPADVSVPDVWR
jgi:hypothetical protein